MNSYFKINNTNNNNNRKTKDDDNNIYYIVESEVLTEMLAGYLFTSLY